MVVIDLFFPFCFFLNFLNHWKILAIDYATRSFKTLSLGEGKSEATAAIVSGNVIVRGSSRPYQLLRSIVSY